MRATIVGLIQPSKVVLSQHVPMLHAGDMYRELLPQLTSLVGGIVFSLLAIAPTSAKPEYDFHAIEPMVRHALDQREIPSLAISISKDGQILYEHAFGFSDLESRIAATTDTAYSLASVSKPLTATGLMVLRERGVVDIDAPAERYMTPLRFRGSEGNPSEVTLRHLLTHTSGLGSYFQYAFGDSSPTAPRLEEAFVRYGSLVHEPGHVMEYSNLGYGLLGLIIAKQSQLSFPAFMKQEIFEPLGMTHSFVESTTNPAITVATAYEPYNKGLRHLGNLYVNTQGAASIYASIRDLMTFGMFHLRPENARKAILSRATVELMRTKSGTAFSPLFSTSTYYALGWFVRPDDSGYETIWHEGGMPGASAYIKLIPGELIVVTAVTNVPEQNSFIENVANTLVATVLPTYHSDPPKAVENYVPYVAQPEYIGTWVGTISVRGWKVPCTLRFASTGNITISYNESNNNTKSAEATFRGTVNGNAFLGRVRGNLPSDDISKDIPSPLLLMYLIRDGDVLSGRIGVYTEGSKTMEQMYPFYSRLERK